MRFACAAILFAVASERLAHGKPCDGIEQALPKTDKTELSAVVSTQLGASRVDILQSFRLGTWRIIYVDSHIADEAFLFFADNPRSSHYVTMWSGGAAPDEEASLRGWAVANAPGIPPALAGCFAWHVTKDRGQ